MLDAVRLGVHTALTEKAWPAAFALDIGRGALSCMHGRAEIHELSEVIGPLEQRVEWCPSCGSRRVDGAKWQAPLMLQSLHAVRDAAAPNAPRFDDGLSRSGIPTPATPTLVNGSAAELAVFRATEAAWMTEALIVTTVRATGDRIDEDEVASILDALTVAGVLEKEEMFGTARFRRVGCGGPSTCGEFTPTNVANPTQAELTIALEALSTELADGKLHAGTQVFDAMSSRGLCRGGWPMFLTVVDRAVGAGKVAKLPVHDLRTGALPDDGRMFNVISIDGLGNLTSADGAA